MRHSLLKFGHMHLCGKIYKYFSPHCCKCNSCGCIAAIRCVNACRGPHCDSVYSGSEHRQFNSPRLVKREAGFPNPRRALIGSNQLWRVNDSPYYRELDYNYICPDGCFWLHNPWGNNACSLMHDSLEWTASWYELTHNTPKHFQTCHKINNSIVSYKTVDDQQNSYFIIG